MKFASLVFLLSATPLLLAGCRKSQPAFSIPVCDRTDLGDLDCHCMLAGFTICDWVCVNLDFDHDNCGFCGHSCGANVCVYGSCQPDCPKSLGHCGSDCSYANDPYHCGTCDTVCEGGCFNGDCLPLPFPPYVGHCGPAELECSGRCVPNGDLNCGSCGHACSYPTECVNGTCQ